MEKALKAIELPDFASDLSEEFGSARDAFEHLENATERAFIATISLRNFDATIYVETFCVAPNDDINCTAVTVLSAENDIVACFAAASVEDALLIAHRCASAIVAI